MRFIGRKLYLDWGDATRNKNYVVALEKFPNITPESLGLHPSPNSPYFARTINSLLVDVFDCLGGRMERKVQGTRYPIPFGRELTEYFIDTSHWGTVEEETIREKLRLAGLE